MSDQPSVRTRTPCVGICSTTYGDDVCRGCKRFIHEVINWNSFKPEEKEAVWKRLEYLKTLIMESKVIINNENLMESKILEFQLKINKDLNPLSKVFEIVKYESKSNFTFGNLLSYIIVLIITFVGLILILDTFKYPLFNLFPKLELFLFNFYETLKDVQLFIKDLF